MGVGQGAGRAQVRCVRSFFTRGRRARAGTRQGRGRGREGLAEAAGARVLGVSALGSVPPPAEWVMRLFSAATASRVPVPRSPPPPRHESGFLPRRVEAPSSSSPHLGSTPARAALAPSEDAPAFGAAASAEGR